MSSSSNGLGISLSGGGYRATAFHLGTLSKLDEMGVLQKARVISTISGGSITGACYCAGTGSFQEFYNELYQGLQTKNVIRKILFSWLGLRMLILLLLLLGAFYFFWTPYPWMFIVTWALVILLILKFQFSILPISKRIEEIYDEFFYMGKTLGNLADKPLLVIGSTNLQTARPFTFSKHWMQDSTYQFFDDPIDFLPANFPIARAVMASTCVPFAFTPITIAKEFYKDPADFEKIHPILVDGGVYDNQGIHKVMQKGRYACDIVITSDAGGNSSSELTFKNTFALLLETVNVFMTRIKNAQMVQNVYDNASTANRQVAYFSLGWNIENCIPGFIANLEKKQVPASVILAHQLKEEWIKDPASYKREITAHLKDRLGYDKIENTTPEERRTARRVSTNLTALSKQQVDALVKHARAITELQVRLYCPDLFTHNERNV